MRVLVLGRGKTGALVAAVATERGHHVVSVGRAENQNGEAVTSDYDVAIDFTNPESVLDNIRQCAAIRMPVVVGTTGWYAHLPDVTETIRDAANVLVWAGNFSMGVQLVYNMTRIATAALSNGYTACITETHHVHKLDAPSGTARELQRLLGDATIRSIRDGENMGRHEITLTSDVDTITLTHQAHSRRGFALGAVKAAEWAASARHPGVYEFSHIFQELL